MMIFGYINCQQRRRLCYRNVAPRRVEREWQRSSGRYAQATTAGPLWSLLLTGSTTNQNIRGKNYHFHFALFYMHEAIVNMNPIHGSQCITDRTSAYKQRAERGQSTVHYSYCSIFEKFSNYKKLKAREW